MKVFACQGERHEVAGVEVRDDEVDRESEGEERGVPVEVYSVATILFAVTVLIMVITVWQQRRAERMAARVPADYLEPVPYRRLGSRT